MAKERQHKDKEINHTIIVSLPSRRCEDDDFEVVGVAAVTAPVDVVEEVE